MTRRISLVLSVSFLLVGLETYAAQLSNSDFSAAGTDIGDITSNPITVHPQDVWLLGGHDANTDDWDIGGGVASNDAGGEAQAMLQYTMDGGAMTGASTFDFDFRMQAGSGDYDLSLHIFGWNVGDAAPGVDFENGTVTTGDSFIPNDAVNLITEVVDDGEGRLDLAVNGVPSFTGVANDGVFNPISVGVDFQTGFDFIGVLFYAENDCTGGILEIDNANFAQEIPEPTSIAIWSIIGLGLAGFGYRRFRKTRG